MCLESSDGKFMFPSKNRAFRHSPSTIDQKPARTSAVVQLIFEAHKEVMIRPFVTIHNSGPTQFWPWDF
jgi:hypothetical protein